MSIQISSVTKSYGAFKALDGVSLDVKSGELIALLGPSGCGKTTLLRVIAGLEFPEHGTIEFFGQDATRRSARDRHVGFVFQHYALFRHMTVFENVAFGLRVRHRSVRPNNSQIKERVMELLALVQLENLAFRFPSQLSGGQRQRVALARALAVEPKVLLLDEPFGALDAKVRIELRRWLKRLHSELRVTTIFVTHDQEEALEVANRVVILNHGKVEQVGTPEEVYDSPASPFVCNFLGTVNLFHGRIHAGEAFIDDLAVAGSDRCAAAGAAVVGYARPHELVIEKHRGDKPAIAAIMRDHSSVGPTVRLELIRRDGSGMLQAEITRARFKELGLENGDEVLVCPERIQLFPDEEYELVDDSRERLTV